MRILSWSFTTVVFLVICTSVLGYEESTSSVLLSKEFIFFTVFADLKDNNNLEMFGINLYLLLNLTKDTLLYLVSHLKSFFKNKSFLWY